MTTPWALKLRGVGLRVGPTPILSNVDLAVRAGERVAVIGPNGAGKSTLFNLISGRQAPSRGQIWLQGRRIDGLPPHCIHRLGLGRSFQITNIFPELSVFENLRCAVLWRLGYHYTVWRFLRGLKDANQQTTELMERLGLEQRRAVLGKHLSYAEQRALEIGITVAGDPQVVLLDEPTAGMSQSETQRFLALIRDLTEGRTLLMVEHDMGVAFGLADRIAVLVRGELTAFDTPAAVRAHPEVQEAYLGAAWTDAAWAGDPHGEQAQR